MDNPGYLKAPEEALESYQHGAAIKPSERHWPAAHSMFSEPEAARIAPTRKRYLILALFVLLNILKSFQWICLASITNLVAAYYRVDNMAVNWTCVLFMVTYLVLALPCTFVMEHIGLRKSMLIGSLGTTLGALIKCFACHRDGFMLGMLGHLMIGFAEPFFFSSYSRVASVWFPDSQVSLATATALIGDPLGTALGFIVPVLLVGSDPTDFQAIGQGLFTMCLSMALCLSLNTCLVVAFFDEAPQQAPGVARHKQLQVERASKPRSFRQHLINQLQLLRHFLTNRHFLQLLVSFGLNAGTNYSLHTLLNQMIVAPSKTTSLSGVVAEESPASDTVGNTGLLLTLIGLFGSLVCGYLLDRHRRYKSTTLLVYLGCALSMGLLASCLAPPPTSSAQPAAGNHHWPLYLAALPLGFFMTGYASCAFEWAVELTYPHPELLSSTLLNVSAQLFGIPLSFAGSWLADRCGGQALALTLATTLLLGAALTWLQGGRQLRQEAVRAAQAAQAPANKLSRLSSGP